MLELLLFLGREQYCEGSFLSTHSDNSLPQIRPPFHGGGTKLQVARVSRPLQAILHAAL